ncbi:hypothetical protein [Streptomyces pseudovenezuelae]|uniref:Uncharacterized protein n=1 Tax=Streptomyces pseudovenezuelae TaxID=67350 RepID=A0ABZ1X3N2_9ACTN|nr:hypothetical protein [Streptomyces pseudovenezuelae]
MNLLDVVILVEDNFRIRLRATRHQYRINQMPTHSPTKKISNLVSRSRAFCEPLVDVFLTDLLKETTSSIQPIQELNGNANPSPSRLSRTITELVTLNLTPNSEDDMPLDERAYQAHMMSRLAH